MDHVAQMDYPDQLNHSDNPDWSNNQDKCRIRIVYLALFMFCFDGCVGNSIHFKVVSPFCGVCRKYIFSFFFVAIYSLFRFSCGNVDTRAYKYICINKNIKMWTLRKCIFIRYCISWLKKRVKASSPSCFLLI